MTSSRQSTLINIFTCYPIYVTQLVTTATVALVGAVDIGTFLAARICLTLVDIFTVSAVLGQFESGGAAAHIGPLCILTFVGTQSSRIMPAFINIFTQFGVTVEDEAKFAFTAEGAHQVYAAMADAHVSCTALIHIFTACAVLRLMIAPPTGHYVPTTSVGALCVDAGLSRQAWRGMGQTLIYIDTAADSILNETVSTSLLGPAAKRAGSVDAEKASPTVVSPQSTLIYVLASVVVCEFIPGPTASFPLTAKGALCVDANLAVHAVVTISQTLINVLTGHSILLQLITTMTCTCTVTDTQLGAT